MAFIRLAQAAVIGLCCGLLAGCTPGAVASTPSVVETPTPSATPTASATSTISPDQDAAMHAVTDYFATLNAVFLDKQSPNALAKVARGTALTQAQRSYNELKNAGYSVAGEVSVTDLTPSDPTKSGSRTAITVTFCQDTTGRQITDKSGKTVVTGKVASTVATVQQWAPDWFVTAFKEGSGTC